MMRLLTQRNLGFFLTCICAATAAPSPARAAFHLWAIQEVYTNASGTLQFIELTDSPPFDTSGFQNFVNGQSISVTNSAGTQTNTFTIPGNPLPGNTLNHMLLFGTAGVQAAGGPAPDYIIPNSFLFSGGGSISFFGITNGGPYTALPTDGVLARNWMTGSNIPNVESNYAGQIGSITVPEPSTMMLTSLVALGGFGRWLSRRRAKAAVS